MRTVGTCGVRRYRLASVHAQRAFTLIEILIALAVFAVIGVLASRILTGMVDVNEGTRMRGDSLFAAQRAMSLIERDVEQLAHRSVRDQLGDFLPAVSVGDGTLFEFTRRGWQNPLAEPRSELQRVAYVYRDRTLARLFWPVLDRAPDTQPVSQVLLTDVQAVEFVAHDTGGDEHRHWPPLLVEDEDEPRLAGVELRLDVAPYGTVERLWLVVPEPALPDPRPRQLPQTDPDESEAVEE